jgi:hypothetical protein
MRGGPALASLSTTTRFSARKLIRGRSRASSLTKFYVHEDGIQPREQLSVPHELVHPGPKHVTLQVTPALGSLPVAGTRFGLNTSSISDPSGFFSFPSQPLQGNKLEGRGQLYRLADCKRVQYQRFKITFACVENRDF